jgi:hypothetical protein
LKSGSAPDASRLSLMGEFASIAVGLRSLKVVVSVDDA